MGSIVLVEGSQALEWNDVGSVISPLNYFKNQGDNPARGVITHFMSAYCTRVLGDSKSTVGRFRPCQTTHL
jgi:hypothetical protein